MSKKIVIVGALGYLGSELCKLYSGESWFNRIIALDNRFVSKRVNQLKDWNIEFYQGEILDKDFLYHHLQDADTVHHLAGVTDVAYVKKESNPGQDEKIRKIAVDGTNNIVEAIKDSSPDATIVFTSSISTYGDTSAEDDPITIEQSQNAIDVYAESKIAGEKLLKESGANFVILRIASIAVPEFLEPPEPWPFTSEQRVEMIHRDDVADAIKNSVDSKEAVGKVFNIAGGDSWRLRGKNYVEDFFQVMGAPVEMAVYRDSTGWNDWYDTTESQRILSYQNRSYSYYSDQMKKIIRDMMEG